MLKFLRFKHKTLSITKEDESFSFRKYSWKQFKKNKAAFWSLILLLVWVFIALLAPVIANEKPLYCIYKGNKLYPAFSSKEIYELTDAAGKKSETISLNNFDWKRVEYEKVIWAYCAYSPGKSDAMNTIVAPGGEQVFKKANEELIVMPTKFKHRMGTTKDGGDVLAGLVHGVKYSLFIGILSMLLASFVGIVLGAMAGYFGDSGMKTRRGVFWLSCLGIFFAWYYAFYTRSFVLKDVMEEGGGNMVFQLLLSLLILSVVFFVFVFIGKKMSSLSFLKKEVNVPVDSIVSRTIEIINSLPMFLVILSIAAISRPSFTTLVLIIGFSSWTGIARFTRAEFLKVSKLDYIQAARSLGLTNRKIIFRHALPNAIGPALVAIAFGIAGAILTESSLSFIGVGVPPEIVTWGKILSEAKQSASSWWLVLFPGIAIFLTVTMYNLIGEGLRDALDPKLKK
ncbi:MAG: ABC transporter permease [Bacteroidota bacterium]|nr:ABC transporter permease [Bacteroidota bacterium]